MGPLLPFPVAQGPPNSANRITHHPALGFGGVGREDRLKVEPVEDFLDLSRGQAALANIIDSHRQRF